MGKSALMVVDVQNLLIQEHPYNQEKTIENIKRLISAARESNKEVIYVRHNDEELELGSEDWQIYHEVAPNDDEKIVEKKYNSAFFQTDLQEYLQTKGIDTLILTGMQTEYCMDATVKSAFDHGYNIVIPEQTNTTYDNEFLSAEKLYEFYNFKIWKNRFAKLVSVEDASKMLLD